MADENEAVEFVEMVSRLLEDTFEAVFEAQVFQQDRREDVMLAADMSLEEFAQEHIGDEEVQAAFVDLFGLPYRGFRRAVNDSARSTPAVAALRKKASAVIRGQFPELTPVAEMIVARKLTPTGLTSLHKAIRLTLAQVRYSQITELAAQGVPRVIVESGRIAAKASYFVHQESSSSDTSSSGRGRGGGGVPALRRRMRLAPGGRLPSGARVSFKPVARDGPRRVTTDGQEEEQQQEIEVEVEVNFRSEVGD